MRRREEACASHAAGARVIADSLVEISFAGYNYNIPIDPYMETREKRFASRGGGGGVASIHACAKIEGRGTRQRKIAP